MRWNGAAVVEEEEEVVSVSSAPHHVAIWNRQSNEIELFTRCGSHGSFRAVNVVESTKDTLDGGHRFF